MTSYVFTLILRMTEAMEVEKALNLLLEQYQAKVSKGIQAHLNAYKIQNVEDILKRLYDYTRTMDTTNFFKKPPEPDL